MRAVAPLTGVLERIYAPEADTQAWLDGIREAAGRTFDGHLDAQAYTLRFRENAIDVGEVASDARFASALVESHRYSDAELISAFRATGPVMRNRDFIESCPDHPAFAVIRRAGATDVAASLGLADESRACVISFVLDRETRFSRGCRLGLSRLSAHLAASYRLRLRATETDEAVLTPEGTLLDARGDAKERASRERLRRAAVGIVRARRESERDPAASLAFWTAMIDGRWTLVERVDTDGKRLVLAKRNPPESRAHPGLSERERAVVERAALGGSLRHIAYELGLAESTVSESLSRALRKLGIKTRAELIELRANLTGTGLLGLRWSITSGRGARRA